MKHIDKYDEKILFHLQNNSRQTLNEISKKIKKSKEFTYNRIKSLTKREIISKYYTEINYSKINYFVYRYYLKLRVKDIQKLNQIKNYLEKDCKTFFIVKCQGKYDFQFSIIVKNHFELNKFDQEFKNIIGENIQNIELKINSENYNSNRNSTEKIDINYNYEDKTINLTKTEKEIINSLLKEPKIKIIDISKNIGVSTKTIIKNINNLKNQNIISKYSILVNLNKIGIQSFGVELDLYSLSDFKEIKNILKEYKEIIYIQKDIGSSTINLTIKCKDYSEFMRTYEKITSKLFFKLKTSSYFQETEILKVTPIKIT